MKKFCIRSLALTTILILMLSLLSACGSSATTTAEAAGSESSTTAAPNSEPVTIVVMGNQSDIARPYMQAAFKNYEEKTGNTLDLQGIPSDNFEQVMLTKFNTGDIPDVLMHFGGYGLKALNPADNFVDFSDAFWVDDILPNVLPQATYEDVVYGLPHWEASLSGTLYNKEIFSQLNIEIPETVEEFNAACETIKNAGITPVYFAFKDVWPFLYQFAMDTIVEDKSVLDKLNTNQLTYSEIPEMKQMVEWYKMMGDNGYFGDKYTTNTWDYAVDALGTGEAAMMLGWDTWLYTDLDAKYPGVGDKFGVMPAFEGTPEEGTFEGPNCSLLMVNKNSKVADAAIEFVNFMGTPENYNVAFAGINTAPVFKGETTNIATPQYTEAQPMVEKVGRPSIAWANIIGFSQIEAVKSIQELMLGNIDADQCLAQMDEDRIKTAKAQQAPGF